MVGACFAAILYMDVQTPLHFPDKPAAAGCDFDRFFQAAFTGYPRQGLDVFHHIGIAAHHAAVLQERIESVTFGGEAPAADLRHGRAELLVSLKRKRSVFHHGRDRYQAQGCDCLDSQSAAVTDKQSRQVGTVITHERHTVLFPVRPGGQNLTVAQQYVQPEHTFRGRAVRCSAPEHTVL